LEFNTEARRGAVGYYPAWMEDGYDVQVRRHLSLGSAVVCRRDPEVLGRLADLCFDEVSDIREIGDAVPCAGIEADYGATIMNLIGVKYV